MPSASVSYYAHPVLYAPRRPSCQMELGRSPPIICAPSVGLWTMRAALHPSIAYSVRCMMALLWPSSPKCVFNTYGRGAAVVLTEGDIYTGLKLSQRMPGTLSGVQLCKLANPCLHFRVCYVWLVCNVVCVSARRIPSHPATPGPVDNVRVTHVQLGSEDWPHLTSHACTPHCSYHQTARSGWRLCCCATCFLASAMPRPS